MSSTTTAAAHSAETKPAAKPGQYEVGRPSGRCCVCNAELPAGTRIMAALRETSQGFERLDVSLDCWPAFDRKDLLAFWQTVIPQHEAKKKLFVDDEVLCELFERLKDTTEPAKLNFRFVLGLILMRKRMLVYESSRDEIGQDIWTMRFRGKEQRMDLVNPRLDEQQVTDVSQQLGQILNEEL
jgi:hypothetical protein